MHILIVVSPYYQTITDGMLQGALAELDKEGATHERIDVPGAFEIPAAIAMADQTGKYDGYIALGCVIRGETTHYDYICGESARGLQELALRDMLPIGNGILTVENKSQADVRADMTRKNKGGEAAHACIEMIKLKAHFANE